MSFPRRRFLHLAAGTAALPAMSRMARAQTYPTRPITIIVGAAVGGPTDTIARIITQHMRESLHQSIIIENNGAASGTIAHRHTARAAPNGYTLSLGHTSTHVFNGAVYALPYDVVKDFEPISLVSSNPFLFAARSTLAPRDLQEFIEWLKANPGTPLQGIGGTGSPDHVAGALLQSRISARWQFVPYRGSAPLMQDLVAGLVDWAIPVPDTSVPQMRAGYIKIFGVAAPRRLLTAPEIPTVDEGGLPGFYVSYWHGLWAAAGTPKEIVARINSALVDALADAGCVNALLKLARKSSRATSRIRRRLPPCRRRKSRNGGRSSRRQGSRPSECYLMGATLTKLARRQFLNLALGITAAATALPPRARALDYPTKPVRWIVPMAPGEMPDVLARLLGQWLSERLGQRFIIDNRPLGASNVGTEAAVRSPADGYTLLQLGPPQAINATLYDKLNFNVIRDIAPVASFARAPNVVEVNLAVPVRTVPELIAYAKAHPGKLVMASGGIGGSPHLSGELFKMMAGVNMLHVPYRGSLAALTGMLGGEVQVFFDNLPVSIEYIKAGKVRALAVTSAMRSEALPDLPTVSEFVPGYEASPFWGVGVPRNTPPDIIDKLNREINAGLADPKIKARLADLSVSVYTGSPADFGKLLVDETEKWGKVVRFSGAKAE
jgi:tripartite-type tricarboxylate transporter receptor subunit TctC